MTTVQHTAGGFKIDSLPIGGKQGELFARARKRTLARSLRRGLTQAECALWRHLRRRRVLNVRFRRQAVVLGYIADFYAPSLSLIIEVDGPAHSALDARAAWRRAWDHARDTHLERVGVRVLRFSNADVLDDDPARVLETLTDAIAQRRAERVR